MLIVEDLMLLLLDDETGIPAGAGTLHYTLGGAVLAELALLGRVETDGGYPAIGNPKVRAVGDGPLGDELLQEAWEKVAAKPRHAQTLLLEIGTGLWEPVIERLVSRGLIRRESKKVLGLFRSTRLPAGDTRREEELRERIRAVLVDGAEPDERTGVVTALLSASGALPALRPSLAWSGDVYRRGKELEQGNWGAGAVSVAIAGITAAMTAVSTATTVAVITN